MDGVENIQRLGPDEDALAGGAVSIAHRGSQYFYLLQVVRVGLGRVLGNLDGIAESDHGRLRRQVRQENGCKVLVLRTGPLQGTAQRVAAADLLGGEAFDLVAGVVVDARGSERRPRALVAETCWPPWVSLNRLAVDGDGGFDPDDVRLVEAQRLVDADGAVGKLKRQLTGSGKRTARTSHIKRCVDLVSYRIVIGEQAEWQAKGRRLVAHQVERLAFLVLLLFSEPGLCPGAAIGENDAIELVLDYGFALGGRRFNWSGAGHGGRLGRRYSSFRSCRRSGRRRFRRLAARRSARLVLVQEELADQQQRDDRDHDRQHAAWSGGFLLGISILCPSDVPFSSGGLLVWAGPQRQPALQDHSKVKIASRPSAPDRILRWRRDDSATTGPAPANPRAARHAAPPLPRRIPSKSARNGRRAAASAKSTACSRATALASTTSFPLHRPGRRRTLRLPGPLESQL